LQEPLKHSGGNVRKGIHGKLLQIVVFLEEAVPHVLSMVSNLSFQPFSTSSHRFEFIINSGITLTYP
jgi:hypothetical protein